MHSAEKILVISHNHPEESPGGGEIVAYELYRSLGEIAGVSSAFLFPAGESTIRQGRGGLLANYRNRANEYYFPYGASGLTEYSLFDDSRTFAPQAAAELAGFLRQFAPDIVHFHHYYRVGDGLFHLVRQVLPGARICLTLHDTKAICPDNGYMLRRHERRWPAGIHQLCMNSNTDRCLECCDGRSRAELEARLTRIHSMLHTVDAFILPSHFVLERYADWGIPRARLAHIDYGIHGPERVLREGPGRPARRDRFAFFGRNIPTKGLHVMLAAIDRLGRDGERQARFFINTAGFFDDAQLTGAFKRIDTRIACNISVLGGYSQSELADRMKLADWIVVPSLWWENSPLVIYEAFRHGRPVIVSDVGGMAEKVRHGIDGLHFSVGDPVDLARTFRHAMTEEGLWSRLAGNLPVPWSVERNRDATMALYDRLTAARMTLDADLADQ